MYIECVNKSENMTRYIKRDISQYHREPLIEQLLSI